ncbi:MAG: HyaD/HybD family hydrogenase maturation endopeptidase [candidate division KSB1 bacterium]|nr:HyaD/HybD family hydrogenase maturation endopeptidase [candidate division KSB1 bacterium]
MSESHKPKIMILGVGNELLSDEGIGVHVVKELRNTDLPENVEVIEGGTDGFGLINLIIEADRLIVIDCLKGGSDPGTLYKFDVKDAPESPDMFKTSVHQISILEVINLSGLIGKTPVTTVIGVEPKSILTGMELSPEIREKIPRVIELVKEEIENR